MGLNCFYGAFDESLVRAYFDETLAPLLHSEGITFPRDVDLSEW
jgi:hypothetical protein